MTEVSRTVRTGQHDGDPRAGLRIDLRPIGSSLPMGFLSFGVGTAVFTALEVGWVPTIQSKQIAIVLLAFVAPLQLIASAFAFPARDSGSAASLGILGTLWIAIGVNLLVVKPGSTSVALGVFLITVSVYMLPLCVTNAPSKPILSALLLVAAVRFALSGIYEVTATKAVERASGWVGIPLALLALYGGLAFLLEDNERRTILPLARHGQARRAIDRGLHEPVPGIEQEAGVRNQL